MTYYSVMFFNSEAELGISSKKDVFVYSHSYDCREYNRAEAVFNNTVCAAVKLVEGESIQELEANKAQMFENFSSPEWINDNLKIK